MKTSWNIQIDPTSQSFKQSRNYDPPHKPKVLFIGCSNRPNVIRLAQVNSQGNRQARCFPFECFFKQGEPLVKSFSLLRCPTALHLPSEPIFPRSSIEMGLKNNLIPEIACQFSEVAKTTPCRDLFSCDTAHTLEWYLFHWSSSSIFTFVVGKIFSDSFSFHRNVMWPRAFIQLPIDILENEKQERVIISTSWFNGCPCLQVGKPSEDQKLDQVDISWCLNLFEFLFILFILIQSLKQWSPKTLTERFHSNIPPLYFMIFQAPSVPYKPGSQVFYKRVKPFGDTS